MQIDRCCEEAPGKKIFFHCYNNIFLKLCNFTNLSSMWEKNNEKCIRDYRSHLISCDIGVNGTAMDISAALTS